jgi:hypothetical protein
MIKDSSSNSMSSNHNSIVRKGGFDLKDIDKIKVERYFRI